MRSCFQKKLESWVNMKRKASERKRWKRFTFQKMIFLTLPVSLWTISFYSSLGRSVNVFLKPSEPKSLSRDRGNSRSVARKWLCGCWWCPDAVDSWQVAVELSLAVVLCLPLDWYEKEQEGTSGESKGVTCYLLSNGFKAAAIFSMAARNTSLSTISVHVALAVSSSSMFTGHTLDPIAGRSLFPFLSSFATDRQSSILWFPFGFS